MNCLELCKFSLKDVELLDVYHLDITMLSRYSKVILLKVMMMKYSSYL